MVDDGKLALAKTRSFAVRVKVYPPLITRCPGEHSATAVKVLPIVKFESVDITVGKVTVPTTDPAGPVAPVGPTGPT